MAKVKVTRTRKIKVQPTPAIEAATKGIIEHMRTRLPMGLDRFGRPMVPRSWLYQQQLAAVGHGGKPVGVLTGGLARSVVRLRIKGTTLNPIMIFGGDTKESPVVTRPPWWIFHPKKSATSRAVALANWQAGTGFRFKPLKPRQFRRYRNTGGRKGSMGYYGAYRRHHRTVMKWFVGGYRFNWRTGAQLRSVDGQMINRPLRPALGVQDSARPRILHEIEKARIFIN